MKDDRPVAARFRALVVLGAFLLAMFAAIVVAEELLRDRWRVSPATAAINLVAALAAIAGAIGYARRRRWGASAFGISALGHFTAHALLIVRAFAANRATVYSIGGLSFIPALSLAIFAAMAAGGGAQDDPA